MQPKILIRCSVVRDFVHWGCRSIVNNAPVNSPPSAQTGSTQDVPGVVGVASHVDAGNMLPDQPGPESL